MKGLVQFLAGRLDVYKENTPTRVSKPLAHARLSRYFSVVICLFATLSNSKAADLPGKLKNSTYSNVTTSTTTKTIVSKNPKTITKEGSEFELDVTWAPGSKEFLESIGVESSSDLKLEGSSSFDLDAIQSSATHKPLTGSQEGSVPLIDFDMTPKIPTVPQKELEGSGSFELDAIQSSATHKPLTGSQEGSVPLLDFDMKPLPEHQSTVVISDEEPKTKTKTKTPEVDQNPWGRQVDADWDLSLGEFGDEDSPFEIKKPWWENGTAYFGGKGKVFKEHYEALQEKKTGILRKPMSEPAAFLSTVQFAVEQINQITNPETLSLYLRGLKEFIKGRVQSNLPTLNYQEDQKFIETLGSLRIMGGELGDFYNHLVDTQLYAFNHVDEITDPSILIEIAKNGTAKHIEQLLSDPKSRKALTNWVDSEIPKMIKKNKFGDAFKVIHALVPKLKHQIEVSKSPMPAAELLAHLATLKRAPEFKAWEFTVPAQQAFDFLNPQVQKQVAEPVLLDQGLFGALRRLGNSTPKCDPVLVSIVNERHKFQPPPARVTEQNRQMKNEILGISAIVGAGIGLGTAGTFYFDGKSAEVPVPVPVASKPTTITTKPVETKPEETKPAEPELKFKPIEGLKLVPYKSKPE